MKRRAIEKQRKAVVHSALELARKRRVNQRWAAAGIAVAISVLTNLGWMLLFY